MDQYLGRVSQCFELDTSMVTKLLFIKKLNGEVRRDRSAPTQCTQSMNSFRSNVNLFTSSR